LAYLESFAPLCFGSDWCKCPSGGGELRRVLRSAAKDVWRSTILVELLAAIEVVVFVGRV
jgi:hypothetical protein